MDENFVKGMGTKYVVSGDGEGALGRLQLRNKLIGKMRYHILDILGIKLGIKAP
jgi:hypothetical protein